MSKLKKQVLDEALKLPPTERAELIENLLTLVLSSLLEKP